MIGSSTKPNHDDDDMDNNYEMSMEKLMSNFRGSDMSHDDEDEEEEEEEHKHD